MFQAPQSQPVESSDLLSYESERAVQLRKKIEDAVFLSAQIDIQTTTRKEILELLEKQLEQLLNLDPLISLLLDLEQRQQHNSSDNIYVGAYKFTFIKTLNDEYLGIKATDEFINLIHQKFQEIFRDASILTTKYKGAHFTINVGEKQQIPHLFELSSDTLEPSIRFFQREANLILIKCLEGRKRQLQRSLDANPAKTQMDQQSLKETTATIQRIKDLLPRLKAQIRLDIAFGIDKIDEQTPEALTTSILNSERGANMVIHRKRTEPLQSNDTRSSLAQYNHGYFIADLTRVQHQLLSIIEDDHANPNWQEFFEIDEEKDAPMQKRQSIIDFRKEKFSEQPAQDRFKKDPKLFDLFKFFENYYSTVNTVDVLKNFMAHQKDHYFERVNRICSLVKKIRESLDSQNKEELIELVQMALQELLFSMKDLGKGVTQTFLAFILQFFNPGTKAVISTDRIAFGGDNQRAYNSDMLTIIEPYMDIPLDPHTEHIREIEMRLLDDQEELEEYLQTVGDEGTEILRTREGEIQKVFKDRNIVIDGTGGDESLAVFESKEGEFFEIRETIEILSQQLHERIAAVITDIELIPAPIDEILEVNESNIDRLVEMFLKLEEMLIKIKLDPHENSMIANEFEKDDLSLLEELLGSQITLSG